MKCALADENALMLVCCWGNSGGDAYGYPTTGHNPLKLTAKIHVPIHHMKYICMSVVVAMSWVRVRPAPMTLAIIHRRTTANEYLTCGTQLPMVYVRRSAG
jgi:hypothetical protein